MDDHQPFIALPDSPINVIMLSIFCLFVLLFCCTILFIMDSGQKLRVYKILFLGHTCQLWIWAEFEIIIYLLLLLLLYVYYCYYYCYYCNYIYYFHYIIIIQFPLFNSIFFLSNFSKYNFLSERLHFFILKNSWLYFRQGQISGKYSIYWQILLLLILTVNRSIYVYMAFFFFSPM